MPSEPSYRRYLAQLAAAAGLVLAAVIAFNLAMDPFHLWRWTWPGNRDKPWNFDPQTVALEAALRRPETVFIGRSHLALGFDPASPALGAWARPYLYAGMTNTGTDADFEFQNQALAAMSATGTLKQAVIELDPRQFFACNGVRRAAPPTLVDGLENSLLLSAVSKSMGVLRRNLGHGLETDDQYLRDGSNAVRRLPENPAETQATLQRISRDVSVTRETCPDPDPTLGLARLDRLAEMARSRHVALTFFLAPLHPEMVRLMGQAGTWPYLETIHRRLARWSTRHGLTVWDFHTAELMRGPSAAREFIDSVHYVPAVGDRMLVRMHAGPGAAGDFGRPLTEATIAQILIEDRRAIAASATTQPSGATRSSPAQAAAAAP